MKGVTGVLRPPPDQHGHDLAHPVGPYKKTKQHMDRRYIKYPGVPKSNKRPFMFLSIWFICSYSYRGGGVVGKSGRLGVRIPATTDLKKVLTAPLLNAWQ